MTFEEWVDFVRPQVYKTAGIALVPQTRLRPGVVGWCAMGGWIRVECVKEGQSAQVARATFSSLSSFNEPEEWSKDYRVDEVGAEEFVNKSTAVLREMSALAEAATFDQKKHEEKERGQSSP